jgi:ribosomal protein S18 acetylase RimI-like enzyme
MKSLTTRIVVRASLSVVIPCSPHPSPEYPLARTEEELGLVASLIEVEPLGKRWQAAAAEMWAGSWGEPRVVSRGRLHDLRELEGFVALDREGSRLMGVLTYAPDEADDLEVVSIDALERRQGVGTALLSAAERLATAEARRRAWLVTTNDNTGAIGFYTALGWRLVAVHLDAVTRARALKPAIPALGDTGIPLRDELEFERRPAAVQSH